MRLLSRLIFADEFIVDEKPEAICEGSAKECDDDDRADMVESLSQMLQEQERLREMNRTLKASSTTGRGGDGMDSFIRRFLGRLDGFDRILDGFRSMEPSPEVNNWLKSFEGLYFRIQKDLENIGLISIETLGKEVNLDFMEVVDYRLTSDYSHNTVMQELKRGYRYKGKVLRDAQVVVARNEKG